MKTKRDKRGFTEYLGEFRHEGELYVDHDDGTGPKDPHYFVRGGSRVSQHLDQSFRFKDLPERGGRTDHDKRTSRRDLE